MKQIIKILTLGTIISVLIAGVAHARTYEQLPELVQPCPQIQVPSVIVITTEEEKNGEEEVVIEHKYTQAFNAMTTEEREEFAKILYLEAASQPEEGLIAVVEVVMNRVVSDDWPNTVHEVLFQKGQFSTVRKIAKVNEGQPYKPYGDTCVSLQPYRDAIAFVEENGYTVLAGYAAEYGVDISNGRDYVYFATYKANGRNFIKIKGHYFGTGKI